jgi:hypothetical protein
MQLQPSFLKQNEPKVWHKDRLKNYNKPSFMIKFYLILNALSYLVFSLWCLVKPDDTAKSLGYSFLNNSGKVEYMSVYSGMELGFTAFFALCAFFPGLRLAGLVFAVCLYAGLMILRPISSIYYGHVTKMTYVVGGLEYALGIWGIILLVMELKHLN